jgi:hypothetical protein
MSQKIEEICGKEDTISLSPDPTINEIDLLSMGAICDAAKVPSYDPTGIYALDDILYTSPGAAV